MVKSFGSVQNQIESTIANISTTMVNLYSAESSIRDVDFADEASTLDRVQILTKSNIFALSQANLSSRQIMRLLQG